MKYLENYVFHQDTLADMYFSYHEDVRVFARDRIKSNSYYYMFELMMKKMISDGIESKKILKYCKKLACIYCYDYLAAGEDGAAFKMDSVEKILEDTITYEVLDKKLPKLEKDDSFAYLFTEYYNEKGGSSHNYTALINDVKNKNEDKGKDVSKVLRNELFFFTPGTNLEVFKNKEDLMRFDMLLARCYNDPTLLHFDFEIVDENEFKRNVKPGKKNTNDAPINRATCYFGYWIRKIIEEGDTSDVSNPMLMAAIMDKNFSKGCVLFTKKNGNNFDENLYEYDKIIPFKFLYNGTLYLFDNKTVKEI